MTNETTQRDELAVLLANYDTTAGNFVSRSKTYDGRAAAILAAGYRRPRTITTVEELDALPDFSIIRDHGGAIAEKRSSPITGPHWLLVGDEPEYPIDVLALPATVLHDGGTP